VRKVAEGHLDGRGDHGGEGHRAEREQHDPGAIAHKSVGAWGRKRRCGVKKSAGRADEKSNVEANDRHLASGPIIGSDRHGVDRGTKTAGAAFIVVA
jgi:hypothetical protein